MNYSELVAHAQDIAEDTLTTTQIDQFIKTAEQLIYHTVEFPDMWKHCVTSTTQNNAYLQVPSDMLWIKSMTLIDSTGRHHNLLQKQPDYIREAYPSPTATGTPVHYALFRDDYFILGPTPDDSYDIQLWYAYQPESITTALTTWLGDHFDTALLNGTLLEIARFQKQEQDTIANYDKHYQHAIMLLKNSFDGKIETEAFRTLDPQGPPPR